LETRILTITYKKEKGTFKQTLQDVTLGPIAAALTKIEVNEKRRNAQENELKVGGFSKTFIRFLS